MDNTKGIVLECTNHPGVEADARCDACAEPCCPACIVEIHGQRLCGACKVVLVKDRKRPPPRPVKQGKLCDDARNALICAAIGLSCCCIGVLMHPLALFFSHQAIKQIKSTPGLVGIEVARAAQVTAIVGLVCAVFSIGSSLVAMVTAQ